MPSRPFLLFFFFWNEERQWDQMPQLWHGGATWWSVYAVPFSQTACSVCVCVSLCVYEKEREITRGSVCGCVCVRLYEKDRERSQEEGVSNPNSAIYLVIDLG